ncbi:MAG: Ig domain-containing protein, partial [Clostridia bacterium]|nr:Ig domain-containing protein [Clostridia bacterium]
AAACVRPQLAVSGGASSAPEGSRENPSNLSSILESIEQPSSGDPSSKEDPASPSKEPVVSPSLPDVKVTGVSLDKSELTLLVGGEYLLKATVLPENASDRSLTFVSSDPKVVTVSAEGKVTALALGSATVTVTTKDGSFNAACKVQVNDLPATAPRYDENGLPKYTPVFEEGVEYVDFNAKNVLHMFTHCLVDYTDQPEREEFYKDCITADELRAILEEVYNN